MENKNQTHSKEKTYTIYNLFSKLHKTESPIYGNYYLNYNEMFPNEEDYKDYFKKHVSLFNDDPITRVKKTGSMNNFVLPKNFDKLNESTLFYIFYFMTRDMLQIHAGVRLYKKGWLYNYKHQIWFKHGKDNNDKWDYFNPLEWKIEEFIFGPIDKQHFLSEEDALKNYLKPPEDETKKEYKTSKRQKNSSNNSGNANSNHPNNMGGNNQ